MRSTSLCALLFVAGSALAQTSVPQQLSYEGRLATLNGSPTTTQVSINFAIWSGADGGVNLWNETQKVTPADGLYSVTLGTTTPLPATLFNGTNSTVRYLQITVDNDPLAPWQPIGSVPYSIVAGSVQGGPVNATSYALNGAPFANSAGRTLLSYTPDGGTTSTKSVNGLFCGVSQSVTAGHIVHQASGATGYHGAKLICQDACASPTAHMCSAQELISSSELGLSLPTPGGNDLWYSAGVDFPYSNLPTNDCNGWTNQAHTAFAPGWTINEASLDYCDDSLSIACCD